MEPENVASFAAALEAGHPVYSFKGATLADGLAVPTVGPTSFKVQHMILLQVIKKSIYQIVFRNIFVTYNAMISLIS